jgi:uncharacterized protein YndB with AHSA1/START domain
MPASAPRNNALEREVSITRILDAPRELVFRAWTEAEHLKEWWGPLHFTNPVCEVDLRVGGRWHIVMRSPSGSEHPCHGIYREIVPPERLVFTNIATNDAGEPMLDGLTTVTFHDLGGKTELTMHTRMAGLFDYTARMLDGMEMGWSMSLDRLAERVATL